MRIFPLAPATGRALWIVLPVFVLVLGLTLITVLGLRTSRFELSRDGLRLRGDLYGRLVPLSQLRLAEARRVDLTAEEGLRPKWRRMGTGLPGYKAGWFRLRNGEKALLYLTDGSRAVYVPTTEGYSLLLSPEDPDAFLEALRGL